MRPAAASARTPSSRASTQPPAAGRYASGRCCSRRSAWRSTVAAMTDGLVDPTVGRTLRLAGYDRRFVNVELRDGRFFRASFAPVPGRQGVTLDRSACTIALAEGVELDLGATAKALGADRAARAAARASGAGVLVSLGGDIALAGPVPDGGWPVRVAEDHSSPLDAPGPTVALLPAASPPRARCPPLAGRRDHPPPHRRPAHRPAGRDPLAGGNGLGCDLRRRQRRQHGRRCARRRGACLARGPRAAGTARARVGRGRARRRLAGGGA